MSGFNITDFPTEILEKIVWHFDDTTSAIATTVCKRFNEVLDVNVRRKYNGSNRNRWYKMEIFDENDRQEIVQHHPFILKRVSAIEVIFHAGLNNRKHWIHQVITQTGCNIQMIRLTTPLIDNRISLNFHNILSKTPNISHFYVNYVYPTNRKWCYQGYRKLTDLKMRLRSLFDENELKPFVENNSQLKNVTLQIADFRLLYAFDQSKIESLHCRFSHYSGKDVSVNIQPIRLDHLKSMHLQVPKDSMNECVKQIVAPCQHLQELKLIDFDDITLSEETIDILCSFRSLETFEPCMHVPLAIIVRLIEGLPSLVSINLWYLSFTIANYRVLLDAANKHPKLRLIHFPQNMADIYNQSMLNWLMDNVNNRIQIKHSLYCPLVISKGKVLYDGVTILSSDGSLIGHGNATDDWIQRIHFSTSMDDQYYEFFSNLPLLKAHFNESGITHLHLSEESDESLVKRRSANLFMASTKISSNYERSVICIDWLEKYCHRLVELSINIEVNHPQLPSWTFPALRILRVNCDYKNYILDLVLFASLQCPQLNSMKFVGYHPISLKNLQAVHDIDLFDNLATLQIFHFNENMENLLEQFNRNVRNNLRHLTLANRRVVGGRYKMNNKTIIAISKYRNLIELKLILAGLNETNTKYLFENCTKLSELYIECNFISSEESRIYLSVGSSRVFADIKSNCISLKRLQLVWHNRMMEPYRAREIKRKFPNVLVKIMQIDERMMTTAEKIIREKDDEELERLFDEFEV